MKTIRVFLVDDSVLYMKSLESAFSSKDYYDVHTFATGELCLEKLHLKPDVIILDYYLNSKEREAANGVEILKKIRSTNKDVPVIMLSTSEDEDIIKHCVEHKATEFIIKSDISFARLREVITKVFVDKQLKENLVNHLHEELRKAKN